MKTGRYEEGARNRQAVLDYVILHPWAKAPEIIEALKLGKVAGAIRLQKMAEVFKELERRPVFYERYNSIGIWSCQRTFEYRALVEKTRFSDDIEAKRQEIERPGVIRNDPSKHSPLKNQDAQGSICRHCGIRSTLG